MKQIPAAKLQSIGTRIFESLGSPHDESDWVVKTLVNSSLRGYDSHGVIRIAQYVNYIHDGVVVPGAPFEIIRDTPAIVVADGHRGWGQVVARKAMELAIEKARTNAVGTVVVRNSQHVSRLGEYPALAVPHDMIGLGVINLYGGKEVEEVAPFGGIDPKLAPNPIAWAAPSGEEWPMILDMTTSVIPEGKVRLARYQGRQLPEGCIIDAHGNPSTDPNDFYGSPQGALLPLGGLAGHKGYGLAILTDLLGGALSGAGCVGQRKSSNGNGLFFQAVNIADFVPLADFVRDVKDLTAWIKSSRRRPGVEEIFLPGEAGYRTLKRRLAEGIPVDDNIWQEIMDIATRLEVNV
jgi:uncharacterized oxidoreductase